MKNISFFLTMSVILFLFISCQEREKAVMPVAADYEYPSIIEIKILRVGVVTGPYGDMFTEGIMPSLEKLGYTASLVYYDDFISPNFALAQNKIDLNIFQHYSYLNSFKFENDLAISAITEIPTISMGIYSYRYRSIRSLTRGITVSIPDDPSNLARSLAVLEAAGIITLDPYKEKPKVTISDIVSNPLNIRLIPVKAHNLVDSLNNYDISVINGNYAVSSGLKPSLALYNEVLAANYMNVVAVRTGDLNKQFVRDIINVIHSDSFRDVIINPAGNFTDFQLSRNFGKTPFPGWRGL